MIVRLFRPEDASTDGGLRGVLEVPGEMATPFATVAELVTRLEELAASTAHDRVPSARSDPP